MKNCKGCVYLDKNICLNVKSKYFMCYVDRAKDFECFLKKNSKDKQDEKDK